MRMNLPNQITVARFVLALAFMALLIKFDHRALPGAKWMLDWAFWLFIVAAVSDFLDGYLARKYNQVTAFGRILDPFVDKVLVGGAFVLFLGTGFVDNAGRNVTDLAAWMVVVIIARELLVTGLRSFSEAGGTPYAANWSGKIKMVIQSFTIAYIIQSLGGLSHVGWFVQLRPYVIWFTVIATAVSVIAYLSASRAALSEQARG